MINQDQYTEIFHTFPIIRLPAYLNTSSITSQRDKKLAAFVRETTHFIIKLDCHLKIIEETCEKNIRFFFPEMSGLVFLTYLQWPFKVNFLTVDSLAPNRYTINQSHHTMVAIIDRSTSGHNISWYNILAIVTIHSGQSIYGLATIWLNADHSGGHHSVMWLINGVLIGST